MKNALAANPQPIAVLLVHVTSIWGPDDMTVTGAYLRSSVSEKVANSRDVFGHNDDDDDDDDDPFKFKAASCSIALSFVES